ncbi:MAG: prolipoprotein diacylglyceryl transferase [bacterium]|nr:prolipoprotein diacylglyceryl transferase [bacterium]
MHPEFLHFGDTTIYSYGVLIALGAAMGFWYVSRTAKKELGVEKEKIQTLAIYIIVMAFVGGKVLFYLENPGYYFNPPSNMLKGFRTGFVFYGSLLFVIPTVIWYFRKNKLPVLPMLDIIAITGTIIHAFGRMGCFMAGCCYGIPSDGPLAITFTHEASKAPLHVPLHPTQLYSVTLILTIMVILFMFKRYQRFEGQLFFIYIMLYALGRGVIEIFRGDEARGYIIDDVLSHSQFISLILISIVLYFYVKFLKKAEKAKS